MARTVAGLRGRLGVELTGCGDLFQFVQRARAIDRRHDPLAEPADFPPGLPLPVRTLPARPVRPWSRDPARPVRPWSRHPARHASV
jgi:hypothetical protein